VSLPHLDNDPGRQANWEELLRRMIDTGGQSNVAVRFGAATDAWPGGSDTTTGVAVSHGLGNTPTAVFTQSTTVTAHARPTAVGASTFTVNHRTIDASTPAAANTTVYWLAIGFLNG
jgi:hypothetical protein